MCRAKTDPRGQKRCPKKDKATPLLTIAPYDPLLDPLGAARDEALWDDVQSWAMQADDPIDRLIRQGITTRQMTEWWGLDHGDTWADFLDSYDAIQPVPTPDPAAGELVEIEVTPPIPGQGWSPLAGLAVRWSDDGSLAHRREFQWALGAWLMALTNRWADRAAKAGRGTRGALASVPHT